MTTDATGPGMTGADKAAEATDPMELVGVAYPTDSAAADDRRMARCFVEEFALLGWDAGRIRNLFRSPMYAGPHGILRRRGMAFVDELVTDVFEGEGR